MTMQQTQPQPEDTMSPEDVQDQAAATAEQADASDSLPPPREPHMEAGKGRAARRKKARARAGRQDGDDFEGEDLDGEDGDSQDGEGLDGGEGEDYEGEDYEGEDYEGEDYEGEDYEGEDYEGEDYEGEDYEGEDYEGADEGGDSQGQESKPAAGQPQDSKQELPEADLGGGKTDAFSDLANSAGAGLLGLQPTDDTDASADTGLDAPADTGPDAPADTGLDAPADHVPADPGTAVEERPGRELFDEGPRAKKKSRLARKADEDPKDDREAAQVHESAQKLGKRSAEVRRQRRLAAPKLPTLTPPKPEPLRPPPGFDPPRLPGQRRRW